MKKNIFILILLLLTFLLPVQAFAVVKVTPSVTDSPTSSPKTSIIDQQLNHLQQQIASRVAELNLVGKRGLIGIVTNTTASEITITDLQNNTRYIDVDELTKFSNPNVKGTFGMSDITKGTTIGALGLYNKDSKKLLARFVNVLSLPTIINGRISSLDKKNFLVYIQTQDQKNIPADIVDLTKTYSYTQADGLKKSGFSKLQENQRITLVGFPNTKDKTHITASRIIYFPDIPPDPRIAAASPTVTPTASITDTITPSTGSGKKLVPIVKPH